MLPVISYKVGGDVAGAAGGALDRVAEQAAASLAAFELPTAVTVWHEPYGDMSGAQYAAISRRLLPVFRRDELRVGPILNGWLSTTRSTRSGPTAPTSLFALWDWFGIDTYHSGTPDARLASAPRPSGSGPCPATWSSRGFDLPLGDRRVQRLHRRRRSPRPARPSSSTPDVWFGCMWNSTERPGLGTLGRPPRRLPGDAGRPAQRRPRPAVTARGPRVAEGSARRRAGGSAGYDVGGAGGGGAGADGVDGHDGKR